MNPKKDVVTEWCVFVVDDSRSFARRVWRLLSRSTGFGPHEPSPRGGTESVRFLTPDGRGWVIYIPATVENVERVLISLAVSDEFRKLKWLFRTKPDTDSGPWRTRFRGKPDTVPGMADTLI